MKVQLISRDAELQRDCRQVVEGLRGGSWELVVESPGWRGDADLYLWDFQPDVVLPPEVLALDPPRNLFLTQRRDVDALLQRVPSMGLGLLLKPVTRSTLRAFLGDALGAIEARSRAPHELPLDAILDDRSAILQALLQANLRLQEYDQDRTNFLARAVHDFRAPLTALNGYCGLILAEMLGPINEQQRDALQRMQRSVKRLSRMSNAMFELSIGHEVKRRPNLQHGNIEDCIDQAIHEMAPLTEEKQLSITVQLAPQEFPLYFEPQQIEQVLINLLDNACKYTPKFGHIEIEGYPYFWERRSSRSPAPPEAGERRVRPLRKFNSYRVDVRDSGPGVPPEHLQTIFEEYTSYAGPRDRSGGGLGLAICKTILNMHDGQAFAEECSEGAVFSFVLPFRQPEDASTVFSAASRTSSDLPRQDGDR
ncbi:MAG TPA: HAMP domain-containing sensor histidine kinase [Bryobacteraceae bacterium]|nr:HAMP domain-containing sensor histidine kinase [Bryobacteraceae bacterium]